MKKSWIIAIAAICSVCLMVTLSAAAQNAASGSASGNVSITPGQANAGASTSQSVQTSGGSANVDASGNATASHPHESKTQDKAPGAKNSSSKNSDSKTGQSPASPNTSAALSSGTTLQAELSKGLDCKKAKPGDEVSAKLTQDVKSDGKVVLHKGSHLVGHVTEAQARSKDNAESKLGIVFDKAMLKGGQEVAFSGAVQALAPPAQNSLSAAADESANMAGSGMARGGNMGGSRGGGPLGGTVGSVNNTVGGAANGVGNTAGSVAGSATGAVGGTVNNTAGTAVNGAINSTSHGVVGLQGLTLNTVSAGSAQASVISSATHNVKLDAGTQMVLQVTGAAK
jgi:hypothetical protein